VGEKGMSSEQLSVFIGHRFVPSYMDDFRDAIKGALARFDALQPLYADTYLFNGHILREKIQPMIDRPFLCIFDLSEQDKPNVFIELGYAFGRDKHVVLTSRTEPPADLAGFDILRYQSFRELREKLSHYLPQVIGHVLPRFGEPDAELPPVVSKLLYKNWKAGNTTPKEQIYAHTDEANLAAFIEGGLLFDSGNAVGLTELGVKVMEEMIRNEDKPGQ
jgi:hypothetical protein